MIFGECGAGHVVLVGDIEFYLDMGVSISDIDLDDVCTQCAARKKGQYATIKAKRTLGPIGEAMKDAGMFA